MYRLILILFLATACVTRMDAEGPRSVYGPSAPGDSAFVRLINLLPDPVRVGLGATIIGPVAHAEVTPYRPVVPDIYLVRIKGQEREVVPKSGTYLTIASTPGGIVLFDDPPHTDPARAQLFLYNLTAIPSISLKSADGRTPVIPDVRLGRSGSVVVNAVSVRLAVFNGKSLVKPLDVLELKRGSSFSVFALEDNGAVSLLTVKASVKVK